MKKKLTAISIAACMVTSSLGGLAADVSGFSDIPSGWAYDAVVYAVENGILKGDNNQVFPDRLLTRAETAALINRSLGLSETADISEYTDVPTDAWYYDDMAIAVAAGIFQGSDNELRPEAQVTREEVFAVIARAYELVSDNDNLSSFNDENSVSDWAKSSAAALIANGYVNGDDENNLRPKDNITRAEFAQILYNINGKSGNNSSNPSEITEPTESANPEATATPTATTKTSHSGGGSSSSSSVKPTSTPTAEAAYVLMNIPYEEFYGAENVSLNSEDKVNMNYDAVSSATNKVGNYGKSGGAYHSGTTAQIVDGTVTAVGGANGASNKGVIWPVKVSDVSALTTLGGTAVTDASTVTVATLGRGQTTSTDLTGYQTLTEAADYSYYVLSDEPEYYLELSIESGKPVFTAGEKAATAKTGAVPKVSYGTNWGDVQLGFTAAAEIENKQINAVVITAEKNGETVTAGLAHLYNVWSYSDIAWKNANIEGLDGATITHITYYCNNAPTDGSEPEYYVYDYSMNVQLLPKFTGEVTAEFTSADEIKLTGLTSDMTNVKAQVYHSEGRPAVVTYLTPLVVDPADDDIDPTTVNVENGVIPIVSGSAANTKGETKNYGTPVDGTTYTISLSSDNYAPFTITAKYTDQITSIVVDGVEVLSDDIASDDIINSDGSVKLANTDVFANGEDDAYLVTITKKSGATATTLEGDKTLKNWVGNWENWQKFIYADEAYQARYPYLDRVWTLAYNGYIAAFEAAGMGDQMKAAFPDVNSLKTYWNNMTYTVTAENTTAVSDMVVTASDEGYTLSWKDANGDVIASDSYTMTGKMKNGLEGAIMYIFTADTLSEDSAFKYFVTMKPDMEGTEETPIAAHYHFQFGSSLDALLNNGEKYNGTDKNIKNKQWYATMTDKDASDLAKYNVILGMHRAEKWTELPTE